ncbi:hypothetical protein PYW08_006253 [Mythimna loreyi]|uniref:Uncharacterized protein n=1 Tax=Mythimna loreyi TaxID=667449 RepID=A0ACC2QMN9_9NEOP|nr:hypothetical protein PYW08_006253 [Mythimna loreyi]
MEGKVNILKDLQNVIQKAYINFKKSPKERFTLEYLETRLELLESDWSLFKDTKTQLYGTFKLEDISKKVDDMYDTTEDVYINCKCLIKSALNKVGVKASPPQIWKLIAHGTL